jgi:hypothetical protein
MRNLGTAATFAAMIMAAWAGGAAACGTNTGVYAYTPCRTDRDVLQCREEENSGKRICGAHGCDCGLLKSECAASRKYLDSGMMDPEGAGYQREKYAYEHNCVRAK